MFAAAAPAPPFSSFSTFNPLVIAAAVIAAILLLRVMAALFSAPRSLPCVAREGLMTEAEKRFFGCLQQAIGHEFALFSKVRIADIIDVRKGVTGKERASALSRITSKHVDFVVCDTQTFDILGVIELDDSSHAQKRRQVRDEFVDAAPGVAAVPILRVPVRASYSVVKLRADVLAQFEY